MAGERESDRTPESAAATPSVDALRARIAELEAELRARTHPSNAIPTSRVAPTPLPAGEAAGEPPSIGGEPDLDLLSIARSSPDIVTLLDRDLCIRYINRVEGLHPGGDPLRPDEVIGSSILKSIPDHFVGSVRETFESVASSRQPSGFLSESVAEGGRVSYWDTTVDAVVRDGQVVGFSTHARDITELRRERAAQERFFLLSIDMLCLANFEGYFSRVNPAFTRVLGFDPEELLSRPILSFVLEEDRDRTVEALEALFVGDAVIDFENRYRRQDGEVRWISWRAGSDPKRQEIYAVARDVTERKQLEAQLRQSQKLEAIGQLAGGIAHDFNNLVLAIRSNVAFARGQSGDDPEPLERIDEASRRAEGLVKQLLAFTELKPPRREHFNFEERTRSVLDLVSSLLPAGVTTSLVVAPDAPVVILGDPGQLEQVVMNLCLNARDALPHGGEILLRFDRTDPPPGRGEWLRLTVSDPGTGMREEVREHLFDPFFTTKEQGKGTGLGLSTVYGIVRQHAGKIAVESEWRRGTTFRIDLPVGKGKSEQPVPTPSTESLAGSETLLVAEDEELVRTVLERILCAAGYEVIFAPDGDRAIELFEAHRDEIELVYLDHVMPGRSGNEVLAEIRRSGSDVPVLLSSGFQKRSGREEGGDLPEPDAFLSKPFQPPELLAVIRRLLEARESRRGNPGSH